MKTTSKITTPKLLAADLFCGAGGFSSALLSACEAKGREVELLAVNHWPTAIETHSMNHPNVRHLQADLGGMNPEHAVPGGKLDLLVASPECTHHSNARGGRPMCDQSRASAWCISRWAEKLDIDTIVIENVREFMTWGPLHDNDHRNPKLRGRPVKAKRGQLFQHFLRGLRVLGYRIDYKVLNSAYYGAATSRERLFIVARKGRKPITWPQPTHTPEGGRELFGETKRFRAAREIIDFNIPGKSIYNRKRPLSDNTMRRIYTGLFKYSGLPFIVPQFGEQGPRSIERPLGTITTQSRGIGLAQPYLVVLRNNCDAQELEKPIPALCAGGNHIGIAEPFIVPNFGEADGQTPRTHDLEGLLPAVTSRGAGNLVTPYLVSYKGNDGAQDLWKPLQAITGKDRFALAKPYLVKYFGGHSSADVDEPLGAVTANYEHYALAQSFVLPNEGFYGGNAARSMDELLPCATQNGCGAIVQPFLLPVTHSADPERVVDPAKPFPTITTAKGGEYALAAPFIISYYGNSDASSIDAPLPTPTTRDRFALVDPRFIPVLGIKEEHILGVLDIRFRMLTPNELKAAMGFPADYQFAGNREQVVKQIGNAVEFNIGKALIEEVLR